MSKMKREERGGKCRRKDEKRERVRQNGKGWRNIVYLLHPGQINIDVGVSSNFSAQ